MKYLGHIWKIFDGKNLNTVKKKRTDDGDIEKWPVLKIF